MQQEFMNIAAHELRTLHNLFSVMQNWQRMILSILKNKFNRLLMWYIGNAFRIQKLTKDILDVTRIESHALKLSKIRFNLKDVILDAIEDTKLRPMPECSNKVKLKFKNR